MIAFFKRVLGVAGVACRCNARIFLYNGDCIGADVLANSSAEYEQRENNQQILITEDYNNKGDVDV